MRLIVKYFFLADILFLGVVLDVDKYTSPGKTFFFGGGGHLRSQSFCIRVNTIHSVEVSMQRVVKCILNQEVTL